MKQLTDSERDANHRLGPHSPDVVSVPAGVETPPSSEGHVYTGAIENGHWVDAGNLVAGYKLLGEDASWSVVVSVEIEEVPLQAYNLTVDDWHTYFVKADVAAGLDAVWVHNDCFTSATT